MDILTILKLILLILVLAICLVFLFFSFMNAFIAAPFVPSSRKTTRRMIEEGDLQPDDTVYDLGSGDGRLVLMAAQKGVKNAVGFEINPLLTIYARLRAKIKRLKNTTFVTKSLWKADLSKCNKLFIYLLPKSMEKLEEKILDEMPNGSLVISHTFSLPSLKPIKIIDDKVKVYKIEK